jgi:hypothetical protein
MARVLMNAAGEVVMPAQELETLAKRVMKLNRETIDELWHSCGWVDVEAEAEGQQALPRERANSIKYNFFLACECIESLIIDTPGSEREMRELFKKQLVAFEQNCGCGQQSRW